MIAIDLFAGLGGFSTGARLAGIEVAWAANHWPLAVEYHARSHPGAAHACQDLHQADWTRVPRHDLLLASPCCQGHSRARGKDGPHHDASRATALAVLGCADVHRPQIIVVENVPEFRLWSLYETWCHGLSRLGYAYREYVLDAADHGVPQHRERLFIVAHRGLAAPRLDLPRRAHVPARAIIEWNRYPWTRIDRPGRAAATLARIKRGRAAFGDTFLAPFYGSGSGLTGRSLDRPLGTVTTLDRWALIDGDRMRMLQPSELRAAMGFPEGQPLPPTRRAAIKLLGNAVCPPVAADVIRAAVAA